jgi:hypothetical protein
MREMGGFTVLLFSLIISFQGFKEDKQNLHEDSYTPLVVSLTAYVFQQAQEEAFECAIDPFCKKYLSD